MLLLDEITLGWLRKQNVRKELVMSEDIFRRETLCGTKVPWLPNHVFDVGVFFKESPHIRISESFRRWILIKAKPVEIAAGVGRFFDLPYNSFNRPLIYSLPRGYEYPEKCEFELCTHIMQAIETPR